MPYAIPDLERTLAEVCGDPAFARQFFADHIYQGKLPDMKGLLATMGVNMVYLHPDRAGFPRLQASFREEGALLESDPIRLNPLYQAGLIAGDTITRIGDAEIDSEEAWNEALERLNVGQDYPIFFIREGETRQSNFTAKQDPAFSLELGPNAMEGERHSRRKAWLDLD